MKWILFALLFSVISANAFAQNKATYFNGGLQYGLAINTVYQYTNELGYFEEFNYGKKVTGTFGVYVNRKITQFFSLESGLQYYNKGTRYKVFLSHKYKKFGYDIYALDIHYVSVPVILSTISKASRHVMQYRYGLDIAYNFSENTPQIIGTTYGLYKDYEYSGILGIVFKPGAHPFFKNKQIVLDFRFSILPITDENYYYVLESAKNFKVLTKQRNFSLTIILQHDLSLF